MSRTRSNETTSVIEAVQKIVDPSNPTTARFLLYKLISTGVLASTKQYEKLLNILRDARIRGEVDDEAFLDNKRTLHDPTTWKDLNSYKDTIRKWYSRDYWADQVVRPIILVEKGTVGDVLRSTCSRLQTPLFVSSGYYSRPFLCRLADLIIAQNKPTFIGYVGDADPSGFDVERAARKGNGSQGSAKREGLYEILSKKVGGEDAWALLTWERLAITDEDLGSFSGFQLVPVKVTDTRSKLFTEAHGEWAEHDGEMYGAEVEALDQDVLQGRVQDFITLHTDEGAWDETAKLEAKDQAKLDLLQ